jgi:hypothetical protein
MTLPAVKITVNDGALGVVSGGASATAVIGVSSTGTINVPTAVTRVADLTAWFGEGPGPEAAALIMSTGVPVLFIKADTAVDGTAGTLTHTGTGTSVPTTDVTTTSPADTYEVYVQFTTGGTVGTAGIKYKTSFDGGKTLSPAVSLGTSTSFTIPNVCDVHMAAGTVVAGDTISFRTTEPAFDGTTLTPALNAYKLSAVKTRLLHVVGPLTTGLAGAVDLNADAMATMNKPRRWIGNTRIPNVGETDAAYQTSLAAFSSAYSTKRGSICAGAADLVSAISGRVYVRPIAYRAAAEQARQIALGNEEADIADINLGALVGTGIQDVNGNPKHHDEFVSPGLDDQRYLTFRTWPTFAGVYVTNPRLFSPEGSDFQFIPHGLIMDIAQETAYSNLALRLNRPVLIDKTTGFIYESDAQEIEAGCEAALAGVLLAKPKASSVEVIVSRTDNILATNTINVTIRIVPLAYITTIQVQLSFFNPATIAA